MNYIAIDVDDASRFIIQLGEFLTAIYNCSNYKRIHMSIYENRIITPVMEYEIKKLKERGF